MIDKKNVCLKYIAPFSSLHMKDNTWAERFM